jgi:hypothetical protein
MEVIRAPHCLCFNSIRDRRRLIFEKKNHRESLHFRRKKIWFLQTFCIQGPWTHKETWKFAFLYKCFRYEKSLLFCSSMTVSWPTLVSAPLSPLQNISLQSEPMVFWLSSILVLRKKCCWVITTWIITWWTQTLVNKERYHQRMEITYSFWNFVHSWMTLKPFVGSALFFTYVIAFTQSVGLLRRAISSSQGR